MNRITITYYGDEAPIIHCDNPDDMERIRLIDGEEARWLFLNHGGVKVYHTTNRHGMQSEVWHHTERGHENDDEGVFEWCDLPNVPEDMKAKYEALYPDEHEKQVMSHAIDAGYLTQNGLSDTCRECGAPIGEAGDGQNGLCGNCADRREKSGHEGSEV